MRVVVADDSMLTREGIVRLLVDIKMPPTHTDEGLVAAQKILAEHPAVGVLVLSQYLEPSYALKLIIDRSRARRLPAQGASSTWRYSSTRRGASTTAKPSWTRPSCPG